MPVSLHARLNVRVTHELGDEYPQVLRHVGSVEQCLRHALKVGTCVPRHILVDYEAQAILQHECFPEQYSLQRIVGFNGVQKLAEARLVVEDILNWVPY